MTAHYALKHAAHVQPGEWVLVACGAGGVGMAAVQIAAKAGGRVIATASTPERAEILRTLGAEHVVTPGRCRPSTRYASSPAGTEQTL